MTDSDITELGPVTDSDGAAASFAAATAAAAAASAASAEYPATTALALA